MTNSNRRSKATISDLYRAVGRLSPGWRRLVVPIVATQILLLVTMALVIGLQPDVSPLFGYWVLFYVLLVHGVVVTMVVDPGCSPWEAVALTFRRSLAQLLVAVLFLLAGFVVAMPVAFPFVYGAAFEGVDSYGTVIAGWVFLGSLGAVVVLFGGRLLAVQPLVMRGLGPFKALGEAWRSSKGSWKTGLVGSLFLIGSFASGIGAILFMSQLSADSGALAAILMVARIAISIVAYAALFILAALIEEGFQSVTAAKPSTLASPFRSAEKAHPEEDLEAPA